MNELYVRYLECEHGHGLGWAVYDRSAWHDATIYEVLETLDVEPEEAAEAIGERVLNAWTVVDIPGAPEYLGNGLWNRGYEEECTCAGCGGPLDGGPAESPELIVMTTTNG